MSKPTIGFIGTGVMGQSMAGHLLDAGYPLIVYSRTKAKTEGLLAKGANWADSPKEIAEQVDVAITIVGYPADVEEVYFGANGLLTHGKAGLTVIDMTTSTPTLAVQIYEAAKAKGIAALDAPVSGGDIGAKEARLTIMVGGDQETFERMKPIFDVMGKNVILQGKAGSGQHTKMSNQIAIAGTMIGTAEAIVYAEKAGLDPNKVLESITAGSANSWSLSNYGPRILNGDFNPGFFIKHFIKDMKIAEAEAEKMGMETPGLTLVRELYEEMAKRGEENAGTQALYKFWN